MYKIGPPACKTSTLACKINTLACKSSTLASYMVCAKLAHYSTSMYISTSMYFNEKLNTLAVWIAITQCMQIMRQLSKHA